MSEEVVDIQPIEETIKGLLRFNSKKFLSEVLDRFKWVYSLLKDCNSRKDIVNNTPLDTRFGLCCMCDTDLVPSYYFIERLSKSWKHTTGNTMYPVPSDKYSVDRWEGVNLEMRKDLLQHCITVLELAVEVDYESEKA